MDYDAIEQRIGYRFKDRGLLERALTLPSYWQEAEKKGPHNQRLEFLGDAVLGMILAEELYHELPDEREGVLSRAKAVLAKGDTLSSLARDLGLPEYLRMSEAERQHGGQQRAGALEDALESLVAAIYLDSDYETVSQQVLKWFGDLGKRLDVLLANDNPKGRLQEEVQSWDPPGLIEYCLLDARGPDHRREFFTEVRINGEPLARGRGPSKKAAEENAAREAWSQIDRIRSVKGDSG